MLDPNDADFLALTIRPFRDSMIDAVVF